MLRRMTQTPAAHAPRMFTLEHANALEPDPKDYATTVENAASILNISEDLPCWLRQEIPVAQIDPYQLLDDPDDHDGEAHVEKIRAAMQAGITLPAVIVAHNPESQHPYYLFEGRHRYNAAHREERATIPAWVAHVDCCNGPPADLA